MTQTYRRRHVATPVPPISGSPPQLLENGAPILLESGAPLLLETQPINYGNLLTGSAPLPAGINPTFFYVRWTGYLVPSITGQHTIGVNCTDGCNLLLAGTYMIANLVGPSTFGSQYSQSVVIELTAGVPYPLILEWQHGADAEYAMQLAWTPPLGSPAVILWTNLFDTTLDVASALNAQWWNGTSGVWYPTGAAIIDLASPNKANNNSSAFMVNQGSIGAVADAVTANPTYASTTATITWSWSAFNIYGSSGKTWVAPLGSQEFTGLSASQTYYFSMYVTLNPNGTASAIWVLSDKGSPVGTALPSIAQQVLEVNADGNVPVVIGISAATPSSGSTETPRFA